MKQEYFVCMDEICQAPLKEVGRQERTDGGACGDGHGYIFYQCTSCKDLYQRMDFDDWNPLDYQQEQKNLEKIGNEFKPEILADPRNHFHDLN